MLIRCSSEGNRPKYLFADLRLDPEYKLATWHHPVKFDSYWQPYFTTPPSVVGCHLSIYLKSDIANGFVKRSVLLDLVNCNYL